MMSPEDINYTCYILDCDAKCRECIRTKEAYINYDKENQMTTLKQIIMKRDNLTSFIEKLIQNS
jgi:hypothetical protein